MRRNMRSGRAVLGALTVARLAGFVIENGRALFSNGGTAGQVCEFFTDEGIDHGMAVTRRGWLVYLK